LSERRSYRASKASSPRSGRSSGGGSRPPKKKRKERALPAWLTLLGAILILVLAFIFIFAVAQSCVSNQESTQVRKYETSSDGLISESTKIGNEQIQPLLKDAGGDPKAIDAEALAQASSESERLYNLARKNEEVPPEFDGVHHYLVSALGMRAGATQDLKESVAGDAKGFAEDLPTVVEDFRASDRIIQNHYLPGSRKALEAAGQFEDEADFDTFINYNELGFDQADKGGGVAKESDPNALHGVEITAVEVAGQALVPGGEVVLTGSDTPSFTITITNGGEVTESAVPVEVIMNTKIERQSQSKTIEKIEPNGTATVEMTEFNPGELDEQVEVTVETGPVQYEEFLDNNSLTGIVTFGL
jgi:hypothetical protein